MMSQDTEPNEFDLERYWDLDNDEDHEQGELQRLRTFLAKARKEHYWNEAHAAMYDLEAVTAQLAAAQERIKDLELRDTAEYIQTLEKEIAWLRKLFFEYVGTDPENVDPENTLTERE